MSSGFDIRLARFDDLAAIARIHTLSWQQTYIGQIPQDYLDKIDILSRQKKWEEIFNASPEGDRNLYLSLKDGKVGGFISYGAARDKDRKNQGEIYALYLLKEFWGTEMGRSLFKAAAQKLVDSGFTKAYAWVLDTNKRAIAAYQKWGGKLDADTEKLSEIGGNIIRESAVTFNLLS